MKALRGLGVFQFEVGETVHELDVKTAELALFSCTDIYHESIIPFIFDPRPPFIRGGGGGKEDANVKRWRKFTLFFILSNLVSLRP